MATTSKIGIGFLFISALTSFASADPVGAIDGRVRYVGDRSPAPPAQIPKSMPACGQSKPSQELLVGQDRGLANVVVSIAPIGETQAPHPQQVRLDQKRCEYLPHVQAVPAGSSLTLSNGDPVLHNVHAWRGTLSVINLALPIEGQQVTAPAAVLARAGKISFRCDARHPWMSAYIHVFNHPYYAVTDKTGAYRIPGLPPGTYEVQFEHELLGVTSRKVTVSQNGAGHLDVDLK